MLDNQTAHVPTAAVFDTKSAQWKFRVRSSRGEQRIADEGARATLSEDAARQFANATKTHAYWGGITPRLLVNFLSWARVEAGIFRLNRVKEREGAGSDVERSVAARWCHKRRR